MDLGISGRAAIVTGASRGIGRETARQFLEEGVRVMICGRNAETLERTRSELAQLTGGEIHAGVADTSKDADISRLVDAAKQRFGKIDILVNNAGLQRDANIHDMTLEDWNFVIGVNLTGQFLCAREAVREFMRRKVHRGCTCSAGKIVCLSSVHDRIPWAGHSNYAASKGGVMLLMMTLAQELAAHKIRVNSISPGAIKTPINRMAWETPEAEADLLKLIPYGRVGNVEDVAHAAVWLSSDLSDYVTGTTLYIDGGMTLYPGFHEGG